jgi:outer membrane cobalamin receptor
MMNLIMLNSLLLPKVSIMKVLCPATFLLLQFCIVNTMQAQEAKDSISQKELSEIVVSGNKFAEKKKNIVQKIDIISSSYIKKANAQNMGDLLMSTGNVFVQ